MCQDLCAVIMFHFLLFMFVYVFFVVFYCCCFLLLFVYASVDCMLVGCPFHAMITCACAVSRSLFSDHVLLCVIYVRLRVCFVVLLLLLFYVVCIC